jgi:hypothetical protein
MPKNQAQSGSGGVKPSRAGGALRTLEAVLERAATGFAGWLRRHALDVAAGVAVVGGLLLLYAETLDLYRIVTPGGATSNAAGSIQTGADQHSWAMGVIGVMIGTAAVLARWTRQRLPAWAAVALAVVALGIVLIADLPDVTSAGLTTEIETGEAQPEAGFWTEVGGAVAALGGAAGLAWGLSRNAAIRRRKP